MNSLGDDMKSVLNRYVKRKNPEEIEFDDKQLRSELKVCNVVLHKHPKNKKEKDKLKIITQISHISDTCETPLPIGATAGSAQLKDVSPEKHQHNAQISDFYIKSVDLTQIKSKSLDGDSSKRVQSSNKAQITTVIGSYSSNYETVHSTNLIQTPKGNKLEIGSSYTRLAASSNSSTTSRPSSCNSLPGRINNSLNNFDQLSFKMGKKNKSKTKKFFSLSKSKKKHELDKKEIDELAEAHVRSSVPETAEPIITINRQESRKNNFFFKQNLPFKSHAIGEKLPSDSKGKKKNDIPSFLHSILRTSNHKLKPNNSFPHNCTNDNQKKEKSKKMETEFSFYDDIEDGKDFIDGNDESDDNNNVFMPNGSNRFRSLSGNVSQLHLDLVKKENVDFAKERRPSCPTVPTACDCDIRRQDLIVDVINAIIKKTSDHKQKEIEYFNKTTGHFNDCERGKNFVENTISESKNSWRHSEISLCSSVQCNLCESEERSLNDDLNRLLIPDYDQFENEDEISKEFLEYCAHASCYKHFEKAIKMVIGTQCTKRSLAYLHYLTRRIVRHIGDPSDNENEKIKKVLKHADRFYKDYYHDHIKNVHKTLENFLFSCNDTDEVD